MKKLIINLLVVLGTLVICLIPATPVYAVDYQDILTVKVFHNLMEAGDFLLVFHYDIHYDVLPATPINRYYHFRLMDTTGAVEIAGTIPYVYYSSGYEEGCGSFYFAAADAPVWEDPHILRISGNPEYHAAPVPEVTYTLTVADYSQLATQAENQILLGNYAIQIANSLQINWGVEMVVSSDAGQVLTDTAANYFMGSIPGLQYMAPQIFSVQMVDPDYTPRGWTTAQADAYEGRFSGTFIGDAMEAAGNLFGVNWMVMSSIFVILFCLVLFVISQKFFQTTTPAMVGCGVLLIGGFLMGWMAPAVMAICTLIFAMYIGYILFFRHG